MQSHQLDVQLNSVNTSTHNMPYCKSSPVTPTVNNDLIPDHDDPNSDSGQEEGVESGNGTHQAPNKLVDEADWEKDCYFMHTIGHDYDHEHGLKFKCSLCNIFYMLLLQKKEHTLYAQTISY